MMLAYPNRIGTISFTFVRNCVVFFFFPESRTNPPFFFLTLLHIYAVMSSIKTVITLNLSSPGLSEKFLLVVLCFYWFVLGLFFYCNKFLIWKGKNVL